ncbi:YibE/F family protein [Candidatus Dojkabacteria bacterium]|nr:YibE/F family protein [Candidatus Dojkabacteria bacterium]
MKKSLTNSRIPIAILLTLVSFFTLFTSQCRAEDNNTEAFENATVIEILEEDSYEVEGFSGEQIYQKIKIEITSGNQEGEEKTIEIGGDFVANSIKYQKGDKVIVSIAEDQEGSKTYLITDYQRTGSLFIVIVLFIIVVLAVSRLRGLQSLGGLLISLIVVFAFIIPNILKGRDPILISILSGILLIPATFYISHGLKRQTTIAVIGTLISLLITGILAHIFVKAAHITGTSSEDTFYLQMIGDEQINLPNLIIGGIIISAIGILDDVTISQTSIVERLHETNPEIRSGQLFAKAMEVGNDHISSMVNTLVLTYTGASIPLLLLFSTSNISSEYAVNLESVAVEIVRTLVSSIGLILAIPLTTFIATVSIVKRKNA